MSGSDIPYHLRPNKFADRQIFFELLGRVIPPNAPEDYVYFSMGGKFLTDHAQLHNEFAIKHLYSFDTDSNTVRRQIFNRPNDFVKCKRLSSANFVSNFDLIAEEYPTNARFIVWLDYTGIDRLRQLQELEDLVGKLDAYDFVRITMNSNLETIVPSNEKIPKGFDTKEEHRLHVFKQSLGSYSDNPTTNQMKKNHFAEALARCVGKAAQKGCAKHRNLVIRPLNVQTYTDGTPMLTVTAALLPKGEITAFFNRPVVARWKLLSKKWSDVHQLHLPDLSSKERMEIDKRIKSWSPAKIAESIGYHFDSKGAKAVEQIKNYKKLSRYYPIFSRIDY